MHNIVRKNKTEAAIQLYFSNDIIGKEVTVILILAVYTKKQCIFLPHQGPFEPFKRYYISVYPIYTLHPQKYTQVGQPVTTEAYTQQGRMYRKHVMNLVSFTLECNVTVCFRAAPLEGPAAKVSKSKKTSAEVTWNEIPLNSQQGFITGYTIFYKTGNVEKCTFDTTCVNDVSVSCRCLTCTECVSTAVTLDSGFRSWRLINLTSEKEYMVHIMASTVAGSKNGTSFNFKTQKYGM